MDASDFLEKKGIDITTVVAYHYTGDPEDGIDIDIELLMEEFKQELLNERALAKRPDLRRCACMFSFRGQVD
jgi:hypothetical protein